MVTLTEKLLLDVDEMRALVWALDVALYGPAWEGSNTSAIGRTQQHLLAARRERWQQMRTSLHNVVWEQDHLHDLEAPEKS